MNANLIAKKIKHFREEKKVSQLDFSKNIGINKNQYNKYERGVNAYSVDVICKIALIYPDLDMNWLFSNKDFSFFEFETQNYRKAKTETPEIQKIIQSQSEDLKKDKEVLTKAIDGLYSDKKRLLDEIIELKKQLEILEMDKNDLRSQIVELKEDKRRLLEQVDELKKEMAGMEKRQTGS